MKIVKKSNKEKNNTPIHNEWVKYAKCCLPRQMPVGEYMELRRTFFAGYKCALALTMNPNLSDKETFDRLKAAAKEVVEFCGDVRDGKA